MAEDIDDYWQRRELAARLPLPPADHEYDVYFLWHRSQERYGNNHRELGLTIRKAGVREYVHVKACFFVPRIILTIGLTPPVQTDFGEEIGQVLASEQEGHDRIFIAGLQAWYYPTEKVLMLWEVDLFGQYGSADPSTDFLLSTLWQCFEEGLLKEFPDCEQILTPGWEPQYGEALFKEFLRQRGYSPQDEVQRVFVKMVAAPHC